MELSGGRAANLRKAVQAKKTHTVARRIVVRLAYFGRTMETRSQMGKKKEGRKGLRVIDCVGFSDFGLYFM